MKTRTRKSGAPTKAKADEVVKPIFKTLDENVDNPPKLFILPKDMSSEARILSLPNPVTLQPARFLACPTQGVFEFTRIAASKGASRSWLLAADSAITPDEDIDVTQSQDEHTTTPGEDGYVLQTPDLFIATPMDPLFLVLPALWPDAEQNYQTFHDRMFLDEGRKDRYTQLGNLLNGCDSKALQKVLEGRMEAVSQSFDTGSGDSNEERHYHLDLEKLCLVLWKKAEKMVQVGLPASLEEKLVKQMLEVPVLAVRREESSISLASDGPAPELDSDASTTAGTSQATNADSTSDGAVTTPATSFSVAEDGESQAPTTQEIDGPAVNGVTHLLRLRTAFDFILATYLPKDLREVVERRLASSTKTGVDFEPLSKHLAHIAKLKGEAQALRSISDNVSRKRGVLDDEEALEKAEAKKRKRDEEEAKKKSMSHGVKKLAKVNTSGMKKMSSFFTKIPVKK